jgi:protein SMG6
MYWLRQLHPMPLLFFIYLHPLIHNRRVVRLFVSLRRKTKSRLSRKQVKQEDSMDNTDDVMSSRVMLKGKEVDNDDLEKEKWKKQMSDHKMSVPPANSISYLKTDIITSLAENIHNLLEISLSPSVLPSLRIIPTKYNIIVRLWTYAFHKLLESLRRAAFASPLVLEHLQDFIYYAYIFTQVFLKNPRLSP